LILNNLLLPKISSFCRMDDLVRLASLPTIAYPQSYPQLLWVMSYKIHSQNRYRQAARAGVPVSAVGHNPTQIICLEMCIVFDHTSRGLAYLALGRLLSLGACARH
jgi:hypothetical protein